MGGYVMWAVLGSLVGLVAVFLVVTTVLDRRKKRKIKAIETKAATEVVEAKFEVIHFIDEIVRNNEELLKNFVPSVGKLKMSDIRSKAREALKKLTDSKEYKLIEDEDDSQKTVELVNELKATNSNVWSKLPSLKYLKEQVEKLDETPLTDEYKNVVKETLKDVYVY